MPRAEPFFGDSGALRAGTGAGAGTGIGGGCRHHIYVHA